MRDGGKKILEEKGMLSVEAVLSLVPFIIVILGIISFTNIYIIHNRIQHSMYVAANELSAYTYIYQITDARDANRTFNNDRVKAEKPIREEIKNVMTLISDLNAIKDGYDSAQDSVENLDLEGLEQGLSSIQGGAQGAMASGQATAELGMELLKDPIKIVAALVYYVAGEGLNELKRLILQSFVIPVVRENLDMSSYKYGNFLHQNMDADAYLRAYGVKDGLAGLDFKDSKLFEDVDEAHPNKGARMIDIVIQYDLEVYLFKLFFKDPTIHVIQRVEIPAWLGGDDEKGYYNTQ